MKSEIGPAQTPTPARPLPTMDDENRPFWAAARQGKLRMQQCKSCSHIRYPISHVCPECLSGQFDWADLSGRGTVHSTIVFHQVYHQAFASEVPYNVSLIQLEEGPRLFSNVVGLPPSDVKVGDRVEAIFDALTEEISLPRFQPVGRPTANRKETA
jgi:uncharacterized OB-fold protein